MELPICWVVRGSRDSRTRGSAQYGVSSTPGANRRNRAASPLHPYLASRQCLTVLPTIIEMPPAAVPARPQMAGQRQCLVTLRAEDVLELCCERAGNCTGAGDGPDDSPGCACTGPEPALVR